MTSPHRSAPPERRGVHGGLGRIALAASALAASALAASAFDTATIAAVALAGGAPTAAGAAEAFGLAQLMQRLATRRSGSARFVERREVQVLDRTLVSSGRLAYEAPDTFVRETLEPRRERMVVEGDRVTLTQGERSRTMQLDASPEASVLVEAIRGTLTGNRAALERLFETDVSGSAERWTLELVPHDPRLRGQVSKVQVRGSGAVVREVDVRLADGDRSVMTIEPTGAAGAPAGAAIGASRARR
jgi:outer membrane lipoprotein-sorting protein